MTPEGWRLVSLPDVANLEMGETLIAKDLSGDGIPVFSAGRDPAPWGYTRHSKKSFRRGTIVLGARGTIGYPRLPPFDRFVSTQTTIAVTPAEDAFPTFLKYALDAKSFDEVTAKQAVPMLTISALRDLRLVLPPLPEQQKIAAILTSVDEAIEATQAVIDQLQVVKKAMMAELLTRGLPGRHTRFKMTEIGEVPEGWEVVTLDSCINRERPICYGILMPGKGHPGGVPVVKVKDIKGGVIDESEILLTTPDLDEQYRRSRLREGDVLLTIRGTTGRVARVPPSLANANITQDTARLSLRPDVDRDFIYFTLQAPWFQKQVQDHTRGQAVKGINIGDVRRLLLALPPHQEQLDIASLFSAIDRNIRLNIQELAERHRVKAALMSVLLTGEVRVQADQVETKNDLPPARQAQPEGLGLPVDP